MTRYYVRKNGSDSNNGLTAGAAFLTIDKAANMVAAGDEVMIGAGVYRELVTMDTSGTNGSVITYEADVAGQYTGDAGLVIISAWDNERSRAARAGCWAMNGKEFIVIRGFIMMGTSTSGTHVLGDNATSANLAYEGVIIEKCSIIALGGTSIDRNAYGMVFKLGTGATPSTSGLIIRNCRIWATIGIQINYTGNGSANLDAKIKIYNCEIIGATGTSSVGVDINGTATTFSVGGITITHCTIVGSGSYGITTLRCFNTTHAISVYHCLIIGSVNNAIRQSLGTTGAVVQASNRIVDTNNPFSAVTASHDTSYVNGGYLPGLMAGFIHELYFGWSPYRPFEAVKVSGYTDPAIDAGNIVYIAASTDVYGNQRQMGRSSPMGRMYYMDASDDAVSDPNSVWTNEANVVDVDPTTSGSTSTTGSTSSNYVFAGGTNAPGSGETILGVQARVYAYVGNGTTTGIIKIYTDALAEEIGSFTVTDQLTSNAATLSEWATLTTPTGGWTWAKVQALEFKAYRSAGSSTFNIYQIHVGVITAETAPDIGAVEARTRPAQESSTVHGGTYAANFQGAGYYDTFRPVNAASTAVTVYCRKDANYTGTEPKLEVVNIPCVADQSDSLSVASGNWEQLSVNFTPTSAGIVRIRLWSYDTSSNGKCIFDDLVVS